MRKLSVFNQVTIDGYFCDPNGDMSWAHTADDPEWNDYVAGNARGQSTLVFGRVTYDMMSRYWPTPQAARDRPVVAKAMNESPKVVFSRTMNEATWQNTTLIKQDIVGAMHKLKQESERELVILGSGTIVSQLARAGLIDHYALVVDPIVLGRGKSLFGGAETPLPMMLLRTRAFKNGNVLLEYAPLG